MSAPIRAPAALRSRRAGAAVLALLLLAPAIARAQAPPGSAAPGAYPAPYAGSYPPGSYPGAAPGPGPYEPLTDEAFEAQLRLTKRAIKDADRRDDEAEVRRLKEHYAGLKRGRKELRDRTSERYSTGMMVGGIVMGSAGLAATFTGLTLALVGVGTGKERLEIAGVITAASGLALLGGGIPLLLIGAKRVPKGEGASLEPAPRAATLVVGPGSAALRMRF